MKNFPPTVRRMAAVLCLFSLIFVFPQTAYGQSNLDVPTNLTISAMDGNSITLRWDAVNHATNYYVYRSTSLTGNYIMLSMASDTNYTDRNLSLNTTYYYKVQAANGAGTGAQSAAISATTDSLNINLTAPTNVTASSGNNNQIYLTWTAVGAATTYNIYRAASPSGVYAHVATVSALNYTDSELTAGTTYYYKVQAASSKGVSANSAIVNATAGYGSGQLPVPKGLQAVSAGDGQITLNWNSVSQATYYIVFRSTASSGPYSSLGSISTTNYSDVNVVQGVTYYYKIQAAGNAGVSMDSAIASAKVGDTGTLLTTPGNLVARAVDGEQIYLTWDVVGSATYYKLYRAETSDGDYVLVTTLAASSYTDSGLTEDTEYYYKVQAGNSSDLSALSKAVYGRTDRIDNSSPSTTEPDSAAGVQSERLAGDDLYATAAEVAKSGWNTSYYAIVVSGEDFADALCSAPLAYSYNAPILLTAKGALSDDTRTELSRLKVKNVIIIGGTGIISATVEQSIKNLGIDVSRIAGSDRYETSLKVAQALGKTERAVVASGESFPDALSIAPIAAMKGMPILLTPANKLSESVRVYLAKNVKSTYVVGGTGVISDNALNQLPAPQRLSGYSRYETNIKIVEAFADELDFGTCYVSTGEYYADALSGSALASLTNSPIILVGDPVAQVTLDFLRSKQDSLRKEVIFGGTVVVPQSVVNSLK